MSCSLEAPSRAPRGRGRANPAAATHGSPAPAELVGLAATELEVPAATDLEIMAIAELVTLVATELDIVLRKSSPAGKVNTTSASPASAGIR